MKERESESKTSIFYVSKNIKKKHKKSTPGGTRTHNRLIRSQTPYPLGHGRFAFGEIL